MLLRKDFGKLALYSTGQKEYGKLGLGKINSNAMSFNEILHLKGKKIRKIATYHNHTLAVGKNGQVYSWGKGLNG